MGCGSSKKNVNDVTSAKKVNLQGKSDAPPEYVPVPDKKLSDNPAIRYIMFCNDDSYYDNRKDKKVRQLMQEIRAKRLLGLKDDYLLGLYETYFSYMILNEKDSEDYEEFIPEYLQLAKELGGGEETKQYALATAIAYTLLGGHGGEHEEKCQVQLHHAYDLSKKIGMTGPDAAAIATRHFMLGAIKSSSERKFAQSIKSEVDKFLPWVIEGGPDYVLELWFCLGFLRDREDISNDVKQKFTEAVLNASHEYEVNNSKKQYNGNRGVNCGFYGMRDADDFIKELKEKTHEWR